MAAKAKKIIAAKPAGKGRTAVYSLSGESVGVVDLNPEIFSRTDVNPAVVHQVVNSMLANSRNTVAATKDRGQVRGGGKKPWKQKGTGRARAGSIRSPLWRGGGVTFGPTPKRNFSRKINKRDRKLALLAMLSARAAESKLAVTEKIELEPKTKNAVELTNRFSKQFGEGSGGILLLTAGKNDNLVRAVRNLPKATVRQVSDFSVLDVLRNGNIVIEKDALSKLAQTILTSRKRHGNIG